MSKVLTVIHIYYPDQVDLILNNLRNISLPYDLYCSIANQERYEEIKEKVLAFDSKAHIIDVANVGYDIWPFIHILNIVDLSQYEYIVKLHTKRDLDGKKPVMLGNGFYLGSGGFWRDSLCSFVSTKDNFNRCLDALKDSKVGMCARFNVIHDEPNHCGVLDYAKSRYPQYILNVRNYKFVAGTMFVAKAAPFQILKDMNIKENLFAPPTNKHETQFAHVIERTIGAVIYKSGMIISDPFTPRQYVTKITRLRHRYKWTKRFVNYIVFPIPIPKIRRKIKNRLFMMWNMPYINCIANIDDGVDNAKN